MVPSSPQRNGVIENFSLPHTLSEGNALLIQSIVPALPAEFNLRIVVNGVSGEEKTYNSNANGQIWKDGSNIISVDRTRYVAGSINLIGYTTTVISSIDVYVDGEKLNLTYTP